MDFSVIHPLEVDRLDGAENGNTLHRSSLCRCVMPGVGGKEPRGESRSFDALNAAGNGMRQPDRWICTIRHMRVVVG